MIELTELMNVTSVVIIIMKIAKRKSGHSVSIIIRINKIYKIQTHKRQKPDLTSLKASLSVWNMGKLRK